jgi:hypothetical protein
MPFTPTTFADGPGGGTPITAAELNKLGTQYAQAVADAAAGGGVLVLAGPLAMIVDDAYCYLAPSTAPQSPDAVDSTANRIAVNPVSLGGTVSADELAVQITTAGAAGAKIRVALYDDAGGRPGALIYDSGDIDATTTGVKSITGLSLSLAGTVWAASSVNDATIRATVYKVTGNTVETSGTGHFDTYSVRTMVVPVNPFTSGFPADISAETLGRTNTGYPIVVSIHVTAVA